MSDLSLIEKKILEHFLGMSSGYVLDFSNRTFEEFVLESTGKEIFNEKYNYASSSKANRLREFWKVESNSTIGKLIKDFIDHKKTSALLNYTQLDGNDEKLIRECYKIADRLQAATPIEAVDELRNNSNTDELKLLSENIIDCIEKDQPQVGLDRLHTYLKKFLRTLCEKHGIQTEKTIPINSLLGSYIKELDKKSLLESEMTKRILKSAISILDTFNKVRNDQSFAHDNKILNYNESILIFNNILNMIKFINSIEKKFLSCN
jgi:hypothetical protein